MRQQVNCIYSNPRQTEQVISVTNPADIFLSGHYLQSHKLATSQSYFDTSRTISSLREVSQNSALLCTADGGLYSATFLLNSLSYLVLKGI